MNPPKQWLPPLPQSMAIHGIRCYSAAPDNNRSNNHRRETPQVLKISTNRVNDNKSDEFSVFGIDDVVTILKFDFENAYFVTVTYLYRIFTSAIYTEDCIFEDPTVRFRGKKILRCVCLSYTSNSIAYSMFPLLTCFSSLVIKFVVNPLIFMVFVLSVCRTYLKLPWRPLICIDGGTHAETESWNVSGHLFTPAYGRSND
ncbi:unnamed protein product [Malus baccata var. baccata]